MSRAVRRGAKPAAPLLPALLAAAACAVIALVCAGPAAAAGVGFSFKANSYPIRDLTIAQRPFFSSSELPRVDKGVHDSQGVRMSRFNGRLYDHPGAAANYGLWNLNTYRINREEFFLDRAKAQARRLIAIHDSAGGAWYFPNSYARDRHGRPGELLRPPWYSAMGQGLALSLFCRLYEVTGNDVWQDAAEHTFRSYLRKGPRSGPYTINVDGNGFLWLQEWPWPGMRPDNTLNGHGFSSWGLYEYYRLSGDTRARALFRGAATTVLHYFGSFRQRGWISRYCLAHGGINPKYHAIHVRQFLQLHTFTGSAAFARRADQLQADYPAPDQSGSVHVDAGTHTGYRFATNGALLGKRTVTLSRDADVHVTARKRRFGKSGLWFRVTSSPWSGYWLRERPGRVYFLGPAAGLRYDPSRTLILAAGRTYTGRHYNDRGEVTTKLDLHADARVTTTIDRRAVVNGSAQVRVDEGPLKGYWVRLGSGVTLR